MVDDLILRHLQHFKTKISMDIDKYSRQVKTIEDYSKFILLNES